MKIDIKIQTLAPDRTNYKQYGTTYAPEDLYVEVEIPDEEVVTHEPDEYSMTTTLTERGMQLLMGKLADLADKADESYRHSKLPKQK